MPTPRGRSRGTSWHRDASAGYGSDLEILSGSLLRSPLTPWRATTSPHQPVGLEYEEVSLAPMDVRPRWPGGFLEASLVWVV